jgi:hypothetical protein
LGVGNKKLRGVELENMLPVDALMFWCVLIAPFGHSIRQCYFAICQLILVACQQHRALISKRVLNQQRCALKKFGNGNFDATLILDIYCYIHMLEK